MRTAKLGALTVLLATSCSDWREDYDFTREGEHVTLHAYGYSEWDMCRGSYAELDGHAGMIMDDLGVDSPSVFRWVSPSFMSLQEECGDAGACAWGSEALAYVLPQMHEVTHTIVHSIGSDGCPHLLTEGLSDYYDGPRPGDTYIPAEWWPKYEADLSLREAMEVGFEFVPAFYAQGTRLVSYLAETYGVETIVALCEALPKEPRMETWDKAVREVYGITLEQLLADIDAYPRCSFAQMRAKLWGCSGQWDYSYPRDGSEYVVEAGCDDHQATNGWLGTDGDAVLRRYVHVHGEQSFEVRAHPAGHWVGPDPVYLITRCRPCSEDPDVFVETPDEYFNYGVHELRGTYEVTVFFDRRDTVRLSLTAIE